MSNLYSLAELEKVASEISPRTISTKLKYPIDYLKKKKLFQRSFK
jgi:hypothetical protein